MRMMTVIMAMRMMPVMVTVSVTVNELKDAVTDSRHMLLSCLLDFGVCDPL